MRPVLLVLLAACRSGAVDPPASKPDSAAPEGRVPGERAPLTASCDDQDPLRCLLPFPSNRFARADESSETGLRLALDPASLPGQGDDPAFYNVHDGFSRVSPIMTGWELSLDSSWIRGIGEPIAEDAPFRVYNAQPEHSDYGQPVPLWAEMVENERGESLIIAYPLSPLAANADYVVVITDGLLDRSGSPLPRSRETEVLLGLAEPESEAEEQLSWYHAPTRSLLEDLDLAPESIVRAWDFTTRSEGDVSRRLEGMLEAVREVEDQLQVVVDEVEIPGDPTIAVILHGRILGVPNFLDENDRFVLTPDGRAEPTGETETLFRLLVPASGYLGDPDAPCRVALYTHGTGGDISDRSMDATFAANGVAKLSVQFGAWNGGDLFQTFGRMMTLFQGVEQSTAMLAQSMTGAYAVLKAMQGPLGELAGAEEIDGIANPAAGRAFDAARPGWAAGSLGGTMGAVAAASFPEIEMAALNVPGGGWTHFVPSSYLYGELMAPLMEGRFGGPLDARMAIALTQGGWDDIDGASWGEKAAEKGVVYLLQASIGDPVLPNVGSHLLARSLGAQHVGTMIVPTAGLVEVEALSGQTGITQYRVPDTGIYDVHGFAAEHTPAAEAAMEQIFTFFATGWQAQPEVLVPEGCLALGAGGACDFEGAW